MLPETCPCCEKTVKRDKWVFIGVQEAFLPGRPDFDLYNCPHCETTTNVKRVQTTDRQRLFDTDR